MAAAAWGHFDTPFCPAGTGKSQGFLLQPVKRGRFFKAV